MKTTIATLLGALAILTSGCQITSVLYQPIPASAPLGTPDARTDRISRVIRETMRREKIPGLSVAVIDHGTLVWAQGFGWRDVSHRLPVDTDTQFQAGSISKPVTALAVLQLCASNQLDLDTDINRYLKNWQLPSKFTNQPVTLRQLLCHRAGLVPHGFFGYNESSRSRSLDEILHHDNFLYGWLTADYFGPIQVKYPPGSRYRYSGGGYCVVQKTVEDTTAEPFAKLMTDLLLGPLDMTRSHFQQPPLATDNTAHGYGPLHGVVFHGRWRVYPELAPAGLWSTPRDLAQIILAIQKAATGQASGPITPAIAEELLKPPYDGWQGIGVRLSGQAQNRTFYHGGETYGYLARFAAGVTDGRAWIIMTNAQKDHFTPITKSIAQEFHWVSLPSEHILK